MQECIKNLSDKNQNFARCRTYLDGPCRIYPGPGFHYQNRSGYVNNEEVFDRIRYFVWMNLTSYCDIKGRPYLIPACFS